MRSVSKAVAVALALVLAPTAAWAQGPKPLLRGEAGYGTEVLTKGTPAPYDGLLLNLPAATQAVEDTRDAQALKAEVELLKAQIANLKDAARAQEIALAKAEAREEMRKEMDARIDLVLAENRKTLEDTRALLALYDKQMERMERRMLVTQILGVLGPIGIGIAFFLH